MLIACDKSDDTATIVADSLSCRYFPLNSGMWREFKVTEINIDEPVSVCDTTLYFLREQFGGIFIDNIGDTMRQIERWKRTSTTGNWQRLNTWTAYISNTEVIEVEENTRYIKMLLPLYAGKSWNGNAYNRTDTLRLYSYNVDSIDCPMSIGTFNFDSVLTISSENELTAISQKLKFERYAAGIGLVQKQAINIYSDTYNPTVDISERITKGTISTYDLIDFGAK